MAARHPYLDHDGPIAFAHRGGTSAAPENTLRAFEHAINLGYRYVETDVHASADGRLLAFHDNNLLRTCGENIEIATNDWSTLSQARIDGTDPIPLLEELLGSWPEIRINIDCKADTALQPLLDTLRRTNSLDRVCIGSFSDKRLAQVRAAFGSEVCTSMGPGEVARLVLRSHSRLPVPISKQALCAQVPLKQGPIPVVTRATIATAQSLGIHVHVWTIDDPNEIGRLLDMGVDGVMTDDTVTLKSVYQARNVW